MTRLFAFNKPYDVLTQFTDADNRTTLKSFLPFNDIYPAGRLDRDSEGLLLLTDNGRLQHLLTDPQHKAPKTYWVQVEQIPDEQALTTLTHGVSLKDGMTRPAQVRLIDPPDIWPRTPPVRFRQQIPTQWLELTIHEGRNRQVRRMTAAVGHPTLRLIRIAIGPYSLENLAPGEYREVDANFVLKSADDLDTQNHRRRHHRKRPAVSHGRRTHRQHVKT